MVSRRARRPSDPLAALGLAPGATAEQIRQARNRLAKRQHPDVGGSQEAMQQINAAAAAALAALSASGRADVGPAVPPPPTRPRRPGVPSGRVGRDHPSFTIEALPVEAYEALLLAAAVLGQVGHDDPPYLLEVMLEEPHGSWCRLELVPDGGGSTVSLTVASPHHDVSVDDIRDRFVAELNQLDWHDDGPRTGG